MSDAESKAVIYFDKEHKLSVSMTRAEVIEALGTVTSPHVAMVELRDSKGEPVSVNASQIRFVRDARKGGARVAAF